MGRLGRLKRAQDFTEQSYLQWALIRALAFGERDWMLICAVLFLLSDTRDFLTLPGIVGFSLGVVFLGPVFGISIYFISRMIYFRRKARKNLPLTAGGLKLITWQANAIFFPVTLFVSWQMFSLFYESYDSLVRYLP